MARPKKAPEEKREDRLNPRLTTAERAKIEQHAAIFGVSPSDFMRRRSLSYRLPESAIVQRATASLGTAFNRLAVNMNQIAHRLNSGEHSCAVERELQDLIDRINAELDKLYGPDGNGGGPQL